MMHLVTMVGHDLSSNRAWADFPEGPMIISFTKPPGASGAEQVFQEVYDAVITCVI